MIETDPLVADEAIIEMIEEGRLTIAVDHNGIPFVKRSWWDGRTGRPIGSSEDGRYRDTKVTVTVVVLDTHGNDVLCEIALVMILGTSHLSDCRFTACRFNGAKFKDALGSSPTSLEALCSYRSQTTCVPYISQFIQISAGRR